MELILFVLDSDPYLSILNFISGAVMPAQNLVTVHAPTIGGLVAIGVAFFAILISAFISGSETAYFSLSSTDLEGIEEDEKREKIQAILGKPENLLATILITNNLVNVAIVVLCNYAMSQMLDFRNEVVSFVFQSVVLTFILLLFGEILPKLYSNNHNVSWAKFAIDGLTTISRLFDPIARLMAKSTSIVNKVVTKKTDDLSLDDLSHALEITEVEEAKDKNMLEEILKFGGKTVSDIMTPRVDITDVNWDSTFSELLETIKKTGYSRLPVYVGGQDDIKGIIYAKDLLPYIGRMDDSFRWQSLLRSPFFVPETRMIDDILEDFRKKKTHLAIVVDEYGGTQGLVTLEDVLEEIVGEINDEYDDEEISYTRLADGTYMFEGKTLLNDFFRVTGIDESEFEEVEEDAETIAGLLLNIKHDFPKEKEIIEFGRCRFLVMGIEKHRIINVKVRILDGESVDSHAK